MSKLMVKGTQEFLGMNIPIIEGGFGADQKVILAKTVAGIHGMEVRKVNELINNNIEEFENGVDILDLKNEEEFAIIIRNGGIYTQNSLNASKNIYLLSEQGYIKLYSLFQNKNENILKYMVDEYFNSKKELVVFTQRKEIRFLDILEETLKPFNIKGVRQYTVLKYRIDYYIPSLNIAIEYDENNHNNYSYDAHEGRQKEIEEEIGCRFIRVSDEETHFYNVGYVIKEIFKIN